MPCGYVYPTRHVNLQHSRQNPLPDEGGQGYNNGVVRNFPLCGWSVHPRRSPGVASAWGLPHYSGPLDAILPRAGGNDKPYFVTSHPSAARSRPRSTGAGRVLLFKGKGGRERPEPVTPGPAPRSTGALSFCSHAPRGHRDGRTRAGGRVLVPCPGVVIGGTSFIL